MRIGIGIIFAVLLIGAIALPVAAAADDMAAATAAIQPDAIAARIDRYRKRELDVRILDAAGRPIPNATVEVAQTRHAFLFGANLFRLDLHTSDPTQPVYQREFSALLNYATLPFYWSSYERTPGQTDQKRLMEMAEWCRDHDITTKGHPLIYALSYPKWAPKDADATIPLLHARVTNLIQRFDGLINIWDVVNEANTAAKYSSTGIGAWAARDGAAQLVGTALQWARSADVHHDETFLYNDYILDERNLAMLRWLADHHELPDVIGIQSHMHSRNWRLEDVWLTAQRFAVFGLPIHFTETTVLSGENRTPHTTTGPAATDWKSTPAGEAAQAAYVKRFYSILFSHPAVRAITWWDFTDRGAWMGAPAGLVHADMSPKPAYNALLKLIHHDWWTHATMDSDAEGDCHLRAFCGDYTITVTDAAGHRVEKRIALPMLDDNSDAPLRVDIRM